MGVPRFAAWLKKKYPGICAKGGNKNEKRNRDSPDNNSSGADAAPPTAKVPTKVSALYVDMNGIIHPCCHSEDDPRVAAAPREEKIERVCKAVDNLVKSMKPESLLYLAMDGVAPRAKMNQQRSRRYMAAVAKYGLVKDCGFAPQEGDAAMLYDEEGNNNQDNNNEKKNNNDDQQPLPVVVGDDMTAAAEILDLGIYSVDKKKKEEEEDPKTPTKSDNDEDDLFMSMDSPAQSDVEKKSNATTESTSNTQTQEEKDKPTSETAAAASSSSASSKKQQQQQTVYDENLFGGFDSNCISPGTDFMAAITVAVRDLARQKLESGEWSKDLSVIVSGSEEPGEGEHKLIDFMRRFSTSSGWPRGAHVIHGLDADLILLCLTLHISNVFILRDNDRTVIPLHQQQKSKNEEEDDDDDDEDEDESDDDEKEPPTKAASKSSSSLLKPNNKKNNDSDIADDTSVSSANIDEDDDEEDESGLGMNTRSPSRSPAILPHIITPERARQLSKEKATSKEQQQLPPPKLSLTEPADDKQQQHKKKGRSNRNKNKKGRNNNKSNDNNNNNNNKDQQQQQQQQDATTPGLTSKQEVFDIYLVAEYIVAEIATLAVSIHGPSIYESVANNGRQIINDFVFLASILGNDFMPRLPSAFAGESAMDNVYEIYVRNVLVNVNKIGFITSSSSLCEDVNLHALSAFMEGFAELECALFRRFAVSVARYLPDDERSAVGVGYVHETDRVWAEKYYTSTTLADPKDRQEACVKFLEGMRFVFQYYAKTSSSCSWRWFYPFHHAPFAFDFSKYLKQLISTSTSPKAPPVEVDAPSPFVQLLCILPPTSLGLLPPALRKILVHPPENLVESFPHEWKVDFTCAEGQEHLSTVMIPFANLEGISEQVKKVLAIVDDNNNNNSSLKKKIIMTEAQRLRGTNQRELSCIICRNDNKNFKKNEFAFAVPKTFGDGMSKKNVDGNDDKDTNDDNNNNNNSNNALHQKAKHIFNHDDSYSATVMTLKLEKNTDGQLIQQTCFSIPDTSSNHHDHHDSKKGNNNNRKPVRGSAHDVGARRHYPQGLITVKQLPTLPTNWGRLSSAHRVLPSFGTHLGEILLFFAISVCFIVAFLAVFVKNENTENEIQTGIIISNNGTTKTTPNNQIATTSNNASFVTLLFQLLSVIIPLIWIIFAIFLPTPTSTHRNTIFQTYCDWLCKNCGCLTFSSGLLCFRCGAPYDETACPRVFASRLPKTPPVLSVDHSHHIVECLIRIDKKFIEAAEE